MHQLTEWVGFLIFASCVQDSGHDAISCLPTTPCCICSSVWSGTFDVFGYPTDTWVLWVPGGYFLSIAYSRVHRNSTCHCQLLVGVIMTRILWAPKRHTFHYPNLQLFVTQMKVSLIEYLFWEPGRTGGDHRNAPVLRGWRLPSRTWNQWTSPGTKQVTWLRNVHSGDWCIPLALRTHSGACQKWMNERMTWVVTSNGL